MLKPDRFRYIYDILQRYKVDILLIQKFGISREIQTYYQKAFPLISITAHYIDDLNREDVERDTIVIINNKTTI